MNDGLVTVSSEGREWDSNTADIKHWEQYNVVYLNGGTVQNLATRGPAIMVSMYSKIVISGDAVVSSRYAGSWHGTIALTSNTTVEMSGGVVDNSNGVAIGANTFDTSHSVYVKNGSPVIIKGAEKALATNLNLSRYARPKITASKNYNGNSPAAELIFNNFSDYKYLAFEETPAELATVDLLDLSDLVSVPVTGSGNVTRSFDTPQYTGTVNWGDYRGASYNSVVNENATPPVFYGSKTPYAYVTLKAKTNYTFSGIDQDTFTHTGASGINHYTGGGSTLTVTVNFPRTSGSIPTKLEVTTRQRNKPVSAPAADMS